MSLQSKRTKCFRKKTSSECTLYMNEVFPSGNTSFACSMLTVSFLDVYGVNISFACSMLTVSSLGISCGNTSLAHFVCSPLMTTAAAAVATSTAATAVSVSGTSTVSVSQALCNVQLYNRRTFSFSRSAEKFHSE